MSGRNGTDTLDKVGKTGSGVSIGNQIRAIMGKAPPKGRFSIGKSKSEKQAGKLYEQAEKELAPWLDKKALELGWMQTEHEAFNNLVKAARELKGTGEGKSFADAADKIGEAKTAALKADRDKAERAEVVTMLRAVSGKLDDAKPAASDPAAKQAILGLATRASKLNESLTRGDDPVALHGEAQTLLDDADKTLQPIIDKLNKAKNAGPVAITQSPEVEQVRLAKWDLVFKAYETEMALCLEAAKKLSSPTVKSPADAMSRMVATLRNTATWTLSGPSDTDTAVGGLKDWATAADPLRIANLNSRGTAVIKNFNEACKALREKTEKDASGFLGDARQQEQGLEGEKLTEAKAKFEKEWEAVETALAQLQDIDSPLLPALRTEADNLKDTIVKTSAYETAPQSIQNLVTKIGYGKGQSLANTKGRAQALEAERKKLETELTKAYGRFDDRLKPAYKTLIDETRQIASLLTTANPGALTSAEKTMATIRATGLGPKIDEIAGLVTVAEEIKAIATDKKVAKEFESEANGLVLAIKTTFDGLKIDQVAAAKTTFAGVKLDADKLKSGLTDLGTWRTGISTRIDELKKNRALVQKWLKTEKVNGADSLFEVQYKAVLESYKTVGADRANIEKRLVEAENGFAKLAAAATSPKPGDRAIALRQISQAKTDGQTLVQNEKAEDDKAKERHAALKTRLATYDTLWSETEKLVEKDAHGDKEELADLKTLGKQARKQWKAGEDEAADKQLTSIEGRLKKLKSFPGGVTSESVSKLAQTSTTWSNAIQKTKGALDAIVKEAQTAAEAVRLDGGKITTRITGLDSRIRKLSPVEAVLTLADKETPSGQRKKAREQALKNVRALRDLIENDPTAVKLELNPFGQRKPFADLRRFLDDIEYNSLRAVPPE